MADYKELLRRAVQALPENNGQARRAVYEKARAALVGQLRAITPPLAARDITTHRLQLEDCIRQVEQEASEAVIAGMQEPSPPPAKVQTTQPAKLETRAPGKPQPAPAEPAPVLGSIEEIIAASEITAVPPRPVAAKAVAPEKVVPKAESVSMAKPEPRPAPRLESRPQPKPEPREEPKEQGKQDNRPALNKPNGKAGRPLPSIVARAEAARGKSTSAPTVFGIPPDKPYDGGRRPPTIEPRRESGPRLEPGMRGQVAAARQQMAEPIAYIEEPLVVAAMSSVREVEVEAPVPVDPQGAIDRAIATLDREARGDAGAAANGKVVELPLPEPLPASPPAAAVPTQRKRGLVNGMFRDRPVRGERADRAERNERTDRNERGDRKDRKAPARRDTRGRREPGHGADAVFQRPPAETERGGIGALTIFLTVFAALLLAVGGIGIWAWREGYLNLDTMFARSAPVQQATATPPTTDTMLAAAADTAAATGPGNTATVAPNLPVAEPKVEERLAPVQPSAAAAAVEPLALAPTGNEPKTEERLPVESQATATTTAESAVAAIDPANMAGSQSLLLEASDNGTTGAVPFSGTVEWSRGKDETGAPTLIAKASIPARNLGVDVLIRKNSDPSLPASHLMEINFTVSETFIGGSVAGLPGVLLKNEELVQGAPLVGASARVIGNSFLFALSASATDSAANKELLTTRKWIDLAIIYATGKRAIITLEKDEAAEQLFRDVFAEWGTAAATP